MKMKLVPLFFMVIIILSAAQPIFAGNPQLEDTKIAGKDSAPLKDITVSAGSSIELQARLYYWYYYNFASECFLNPSNMPLFRI